VRPIWILPVASSPTLLYYYGMYKQNNTGVATKPIQTRPPLTFYKTDGSTGGSLRSVLWLGGSLRVGIVVGCYCCGECKRENDGTGEGGSNGRVCARKKSKTGNILNYSSCCVCCRFPASLLLEFSRAKTAKPLPPHGRTPFCTDAHCIKTRQSISGSPKHVAAAFGLYLKTRNCWTKCGNRWGCRAAPFAGNHQTGWSPQDFVPGGPWDSCCPCWAVGRCTAWRWHERHLRRSRRVSAVVRGLPCGPSTRLMVSGRTPLHRIKRARCCLITAAATTTHNNNRCSSKPITIAPFLIQQ
jgi:hypothetical protein